MTPFWRSFFLIGALSCSGGLHALPGEFQVTAGEAVVKTSDPGTLLIESSGNTIIQWDHFSIGQEEIARFQQADSQSAVLNRVLGGSESAILGLLESNGRVYLINPNGVFIGPDARIETTGFLASTFDVLNADFLANQELLLSGDSKAWIQNFGTISCSNGDITLVARFIKNEGNLIAVQGAVSLASAPEVLLKIEGKERIFIRPDLGVAEPTEEGPFSIEHTGRIEALAVELKSGASPHLQAIRNAGPITAIGTTEENGHVYLVAEHGWTEVSSSITAKRGDFGGEVRILGDRAAVQSGTIDVSGNRGGGEVLINGDYQGANPSVPNGKITEMESKVAIHADALVDGDGGKVILWGDQATRFSGFITARGGRERGNGGFVEVSSPGVLLPYGLVNTSASNGKFGTLLYDPTDVTITAAIDANIATSGPTYTYTGGGVANIDVAGLIVNLATNNVVINTDTQISAGLTGTITVSSPITWSAATTLTLNANRSILISADITNMFMAATPSFTALECIANEGNFTGAAATSVGIHVSPGVTISTDRGDILFKGTGGNLAGANVGINIDVATVSSTNGNIEFIGHGTPEGVALGTSSRGIVVSGAGALTASVIATNGNISMSGFAGNGLTGNNGIQIIGNSAVTAGGSVYLYGRGNGTLTDNYGVIIQGGVLSDTVVSATGSGTVTIEGDGGSGTTRNHGVVLQGAPGFPGTAQTQNGNLTLIGRAHGTADRNVGVAVDIDGFVHSAAGNVLISGTAGGTFSNDGVTVRSTIQLDDPIQSGNLQIIGKSYGTDIDNVGVLIEASLGTGTITVNNTGSILIEGIGGPGTTNNHGIGMLNASTISAVDGNIRMIGSTHGTGTDNSGIFLRDGSQVISTGVLANGASILLEGTSTNIAATSNEIGVRIENTANAVTTVDHDIEIVGYGSTPSTVGANHGIAIGLTTSGSPSSVTATGLGKITLTGFGGGGTTSAGVYTANGAAGGPSGISTLSGDIEILGESSAVAISSPGILIDNFSRIVTNTGNLGMTGISAGTVTGNHGIHFLGDGTKNNVFVGSTGNGNGTIALLGIGSPNGTNNNDGILIDNGATLTSAGMVSGSSITLTGIGQGMANSNVGVEVDSLGEISIANTGTAFTIHIDGRGSNLSVGGIDNRGVYIHGTGTIISTAEQDIIINGESGAGTNEALTIDTASVIVTTVGNNNNIELTARAFDNTGGDLFLTNQAIIFPTFGAAPRTTLNVARDLQILTEAQTRSTNLIVRTGRDLLIDATGGAGTQETGLFAIDLDAIIGGELTLLGGNAVNGSAVITNFTGTASIIVGGNLALTGGSAAGAYAQIGADSIALASGGPILFPSIGGNVNVTGGLGSYALIGHGNPTMTAFSSTTSITLQQVGGFLNLTAGGAVNAFAQIGHLSPAAGAPDLSGDIYINALNPLLVHNVTLTGSAFTYVQIGHGSPLGGSATFAGRGAVTVIAGNSIVMGGGGGAATGAYIVNPSTNNNAAFPHSGSITLITDNNNPLEAYLSATSGISMNGSSFINNNALSNGQVRIYTVQQSLNTLSLINGTVFIPTPTPGIDTVYEKFSVYYGSGTFNGPEFSIYYKTPISTGFVCPPSGVCPFCPSGGGGGGSATLPQMVQLAVANAQMTDMFSRLIGQTVNNSYHGQGCDFALSDEDMEPNASSCSPGFFRFESFVFENSVDRILPR